ncbi:MAG: ABC transporter substrate-binding protein, partial [Chloroflexota bacterium]|nr:ABC transporter substrate-binding protein [Chloroflexota bacterium]
MSKAVSAFSSLLLVTSLLLGACAPAAAPTPKPAPPVVQLTPTPGQTPLAIPTPAPIPTVTPAPTPRATPKPVVAEVMPTGEKPQYGGVLATINAIDLAHLDIHQQTTGLAVQPLAPFYSLLVQPDPKNSDKVIPDLAERWDISADGKTYTFHLRKGVKFHDGTPLTAADVVESLSRGLRPRSGILAPRAGFYINVDKIEAPDDFTVRITLKAPQANFMGVAALPFGVIYPKPVLDKKGDMKKDVVGSGPFKFVEYVRGVSIKAVRNPDYFIKGRPYLDGIDRYIIKDEAAKVAAFRSGQVDLMAGMQQNTSPAERAVMQKENPKIQVQKVTGSTFQALTPNFTRKPWDDKRVRQAVNLAVDKHVFVELVQYGDAVVGGFMFPGGPWGMPHEELLKLPGYRKPTADDLVQARKLLSEAGYPKGFKFTVASRSLADYVKRAVLAKEQLKAIGLEVEIDIREDARFYSTLGSGEFDIAIYGLGTPLPEPDQYLADSYLTGSINWGKYSNKTVDDLYVQQSREMDPAKRQKLLRQIEDILLDELPLIPNYWKAYSALVGPRVRDYVLTGIYT